jgi:hypothetical protein
LIVNETLLILVENLRVIGGVATTVFNPPNLGELRTILQPKDRRMAKRVEFHLVKVIQKLEIFCDLSQKEALEVLQLCQRRSLLEGEIIWNPGDPGDSMLVLLSGKLHVQNKESKVVGESSQAAPLARWPVCRAALGLSDFRWSKTPRHYFSSGPHSAA